jgi:16S rRNA (guanine527-N7)-methyltransferase
MQILEKYFPDLSPQQVEQYLHLRPLYNHWNERINIISRKDIENLYLHHVLHSLAIARIISFKAGTAVMDAGTGGGFPGIPLAILFPDVRFILVDSIAKKIRVVENLIQEIRLRNAEVRNIRLEGFKEKSDFVVCRAVAEIPVIFGWVKKNISPGGFNDIPNGLLALKGGELEKELRSVKQDIKVYNLNEYFNETYFETKKLVYVRG